MPVCNIATAENMFEALDKVMEEHEIPWENVVGYASDTANVMVGAHNSVLSRIRDKQSKVFSLGCLCHLANLCSDAALKTLPVSIDSLLIHVFYHFKYSAKRWERFSEIQAEFEDIRPLRVLKHSTTRWLSLLRCLKRLLDQWPALHSYFDRQAEEEPNDGCVQRVATSLKSFEVKLICLFALFALQPSVLPRGLWRQGALRLTGWLRNMHYAFMLARYALISVVQTYCTHTHLCLYMYVLDSIVLARCHDLRLALAYSLLA